MKKRIYTSLALAALSLTVLASCNPTQTDAQRGIAMIDKTNTALTKNHENATKTRRSNAIDTKKNVDNIFDSVSSFMDYMYENGEFYDSSGAQVLYQGYLSVYYVVAKATQETLRQLGDEAFSYSFDNINSTVTASSNVNANGLLTAFKNILTNFTITGFDGEDLLTSHTTYDQREFLESMNVPIADDLEGTVNIYFEVFDYSTTNYGFSYTLETNTNEEKSVQHLYFNVATMKNVLFTYSEKDGFDSFYAEVFSDGKIHDEEFTNRDGNTSDDEMLAGAALLKDKLKTTNEERYDKLVEENGPLTTYNEALNIEFDTDEFVSLSSIPITGGFGNEGSVSQIPIPSVTDDEGPVDEYETVHNSYIAIEKLITMLTPPADSDDLPLYDANAESVTEITNDSSLYTYLMQQNTEIIDFTNHFYDIGGDFTTSGYIHDALIMTQELLYKTETDAFNTIYNNITYSNNIFSVEEIESIEIAGFGDGLFQSTVNFIDGGEQVEVNIMIDNNDTTTTTNISVELANASYFLSGISNHVFGTKELYSISQKGGSPTIGFTNTIEMIVKDDNVGIQYHSYIENIHSSIQDVKTFLYTENTGEHIPENIPTNNTPIVLGVA